MNYDKLPYRVWQSDARAPIQNANPFPWKRYPFKGELYITHKGTGEQFLRFIEALAAEKPVSGNQLSFAWLFFTKFIRVWIKF